jgi:hypothetical protein
MLCNNNRLSNMLIRNRLYKRELDQHLYSAFILSSYVFVSDEQNMPAKLAHFATK